MEPAELLRSLGARIGIELLPDDSRPNLAVAASFDILNA